MSQPTLRELEHRRAAACLRLDDRRYRLVGALPGVEEGLAMLARDEFIRRVRSAATVPVLLIATAGGTLLLLRRSSRPRLWTLAVLGWRAWKFWNELSHTSS